jgi:predicted RNase H-like HicB family nuclease
MIYPLFIFKADDGTFDGYFPDIEGCMFAGNNLESALRDAESAFGQHMEVLTEQGGHVPAPSDPADYLGDERLTMDNGFWRLSRLTHQNTKQKPSNLISPCLVIY